jgi:hypothetical protein
MTTAPIATQARTGGRLLLISGLVLPFLGIAAFVVQVSLSRLMLPWYVPALALLGVVFVAVSLWRRRTVWRVLALVVVVLLAGLEMAALYAMRLPPYAGPVAVGRPMPAFEAKRADGTAYTQNDLTGERNQVLVFFRGRW